MKKLFLVSCYFALVTNCLSQKFWHVDFTPGLVVAPPTPLTIHQDGHEKIRLWAKYETAPLKRPPYYSYRIGFEENNLGWELEMNHLKIYLKNTGTEIERFSVSHGYNQVVVNRIRNFNHFGTKFGTGLVVAHPESTVREQKFNERMGLFNKGYYIAGPVMQYGIFKKTTFGKRFYALAEARFSAAYAFIPISNGIAHTPVVAIHLQLGPGCYFLKSGIPKQKSK